MSSTIFKAATYNEAKLFIIGKLNISVPIHLLGNGSNGKSYLLRDIESLLKDKGYCAITEVTGVFMEACQGKVITTSNCAYNSNKHCFIVDMTGIEPHVQQRRPDFNANLIMYTKI